MADRDTKLTLTAGLASVAVSAVLVGLKLWALAATGALSIAASLADSALDLMMSLAAAAALIYAARPADEDHAFGHSSAEDLAALAQATFILVSAAVIGWAAGARLMAPTPQPLAAEGLGMAVMAHPAFAGALRIAPELLYGKIFRLFGADAVIYPNYGGRFSYSQQTCADLAANLRRPWGPIKDALPVPAGGMQVDRVQEMIDFYGDDTILLIGGSLYMAGDALFERSRTFAENVQKGSRA